MFIFISEEDVIDRYNAYNKRLIKLHLGLSLVQWNNKSRMKYCLPGDIRLKFIFAPFVIIVGGFTVHIFIMFSYAFWNLKLHVFFLF